MKKVVLFCVVLTLAFASCVKNSSEYKTLQARTDSLALANAKTNLEMDQIMSLLNDVEDNFRSIKSAENYLSVQSGSSGELTPSTRERIQSDMQFITETLEKNRKQISDLEAKLKKSNLNSSQLAKTLANLRAELEEKTTSLVSLRDELAKRDQQIVELSENVTHLSNDVKALSAESRARQVVIDQQQAEINTAYYRFGTSKELKEAAILVKGQLGTNFDKASFIKIDNLNTVKEIPLYAKKGKLVSKHPAGSYELGKDANGKAELRIFDPKNFWSLTKFLVVEVNV